MEKALSYKHESNRNCDERHEPVARVDDIEFERPLLPQDNAEHNWRDKTDPCPDAEFNGADNIKDAPRDTEVIHHVCHKHGRECRNDNDNGHPCRSEHFWVIPRKADNYRNNSCDKNRQPCYFVHITMKS